LDGPLENGNYDHFSGRYENSTIRAFLEYNGWTIGCLINTELDIFFAHEMDARLFDAGIFRLLRLTEQYDILLLIRTQLEKKGFKRIGIL